MSEMRLSVIGFSPAGESFCDVTFAVDDNNVIAEFEIPQVQVVEQRFQ